MTDQQPPERPHADVWEWGSDPAEHIRQCGRDFAHHPHETILGRCPGRRVHADPRYRRRRPEDHDAE